MKRRALDLVARGDVLSGKAPPDFERLARTCQVGSDDHRGVLATVSTMALRAAVACTPPSARGPLTEALATLRQLVQVETGQWDSHSSSIEKARASCFQAASAIEDATARAVQGAQGAMTAATGTPAVEAGLDHHAAHVVERYARLSAHFACAAVCHALDATHEPELAIEVVEDARGALSYQRTGLGAARQPALRAAAVEQAQWEGARFGHCSAQDVLSIQVFHEYLGARYRAQVEAERLVQYAFIAWALSGRPTQHGASGNRST